MSTLAGGPMTGFADGVGAQARFNGPAGLAVDGDGNVLVADAGNHRIRRIAPDGTVTTLPGSGVSGSEDGAAAAATFTEPTGVALGPKGGVYVLEVEPPRVRRISTDGQVVTVGRLTPEPGPP